MTTNLISYFTSGNEKTHSYNYYLLVSNIFVCTAIYCSKKWNSN